MEIECPNSSGESRLIPRLFGHQVFVGIKKIENICAYLRGIRIPTFLPVAVYFPAWSGEFSLCRAPFANGCVRVFEISVGAEVHGGRHSASGQLRAMNPLVAGERLGYLGPDFDNP